MHEDARRYAEIRGDTRRLMITAITHRSATAHADPRRYAEIRGDTRGCKEVREDAKRYAPQVLQRGRTGAACPTERRSCGPTRRGPLSPRAATCVWFGTVRDGSGRCWTSPGQFWTVRDGPGRLWTARNGPGKAEAVRERRGRFGKGGGGSGWPGRARPAAGSAGKLSGGCGAGGV